MAVAVHTNEPRFLFFWNHKVASRSLLSVLEEEFPGLRVYPQSAFRPLADDRDWHRFLIVRSPWARAASCHRNKCRDAMDGLRRNGDLEPCQRHLLRALGVRPSTKEAGARVLAELSFADFAALLPVVRDGNSHFRLQVDVLRHADAPSSRFGWAVRAGRAAGEVARTHYRTPRFLRPTLNSARDAAALAAAREATVRWLRLEDLPEAWSEVERALGRRIALGRRAKTADGDDWRAAYDPALREQIGSLYRPDVELFGYQFQPLNGG
ncbi:MAG: sulfotransferase family 2 domain-containing protein [Longimicrobiales bacterium]